MRALVLLTLALAPVAGAAPVCIQLGCYAAEDRDADGAPDWVNAATSVGHAAVLNVNVDRAAVIYEVAVTSEESVEPFHTVALIGYVDAPRDAEAYVEVNEGDEETGRLVVLAWAQALARDADADGRADDVEARAANEALRVRDADADGWPEVESSLLP